MKILFRVVKHHIHIYISQVITLLIKHLLGNCLLQVLKPYMQKKSNCVDTNNKIMEISVSQTRIIQSTVATNQGFVQR